MLTEYHSVTLIDKAGKNNFEAEVNWNPEDEKTNHSKIIKLTCPDGKSAYITREDLLQFFFAIGKPEDQQNLMPQTLTNVRWYETVLEVKATKDIRKGESITFPVKLSLPAMRQEVIGGIQSSKTKTNIPLIGQ